MMKKKRRYSPDLIAEFYASIMTRRWKPMFRFTARLTEQVDPALLNRALELTLPRFPYFCVALRKGLFRHYFEERDMDIRAQDDGGRPFAPAGNGEPHFRVRYHERTVSVEMQHVLADGCGAMAFLKTLLAQYFMLLGVEVPAAHGVLDVREAPDPEEYEDAYLRHGRKSAYRSSAEERAYHVKGRVAVQGNAVVTTGVMRTQDVLDRARAHGASVTEYLSAVLAQSILSLQREENPKDSLPVKLSITADLRKLYPTKTMRSFAQFANPGVRQGSGDMPFGETLAQFKLQCGSLFAREHLEDRLGETVKLFRHPLLRAVPLPIRRAAIVLIHRHIGERVFTTNFSNLGAVELPEALRGRVERFETTGSNFRYIKLECGVISFNGVLTVAFSTALDHTRVQDAFFTLLAAEGIPVSVETNAQLMQDDPLFCRMNNRMKVFTADGGPL